MCRLINVIRETSWFRSYKRIFLYNLNLIVMLCQFSEFQTRYFKQRILKINCKCISGFFQVLKLCSEFTWNFFGQFETTRTRPEYTPDWSTWCPHYWESKNCTNPGIPIVLDYIDIPYARYHKPILVTSCSWIHKGQNFLKKPP